MTSTYNVDAVWEFQIHHIPIVLLTSKRKQSIWSKVLLNFDTVNVITVPNYFSNKTNHYQLLCENACLKQISGGRYWWEVETASQILSVFVSVQWKWGTVPMERSKRNSFQYQWRSVEFEKIGIRVVSYHAYIGCINLKLNFRRPSQNKISLMDEPNYEMYMHVDTVGIINTMMVLFLYIILP